jgi:hypothetical protein
VIPKLEWIQYSTHLETILPQSDGFICAASGKERFANANIQASNLLGMKTTCEVFEFDTAMFQALLQIICQFYLKLEFGFAFAISS